MGIITRGYANLITATGPNAIADGTIVNDDINASASIVNSKLSGVGITEADCWRLTVDITATNADITANLERDDATGFGYLGTGMTESSGVFTFPSTGIYQIIFYSSWGVENENESYANIQTTTDNSTYTTRGIVFASTTGNAHIKSASSSCFLDVTSTTNCKVKFATGSMNASCTLRGNTNSNDTCFVFIRLGDT